MRKITSILLIAFMIIALSACSHAYEYANGKTVDGVYYVFNKYNKTCFAASYTWDEDINNTAIVIQDEVDGYKVTELGGFCGKGMPTPFCITVSREDGVLYEEGSEPENVNVQNVVFNIHLGKYLKAFENVDSFGDRLVFDEAGYAFYPKFDVDPENKNFSTDENGVLNYSKYSQEALERIKQFSFISDSITE